MNQRSSQPPAAVKATSRLIALVMPIVTSTAMPIALSLCMLITGCHDQAASLATVDAHTTSETVNTRPGVHRDWRISPGIPLDLTGVDRHSPQFMRFKTWVDNAVAGNPDYGFSAADAAILERITDQTYYCELAVRMVEASVADAEVAIADGRAPQIAGDSYLDIGPQIVDLSLTLDTCRAHIPAKQIARWSKYAEQAVWNVWHPYLAHWGNRPHPWSGWSIDNPGNNYYYSFVEATLYWALASGSEDWMRILGEEKLPALQTYFAKLPGGGSLEGTGYGASHMRLFALYRLWRDATGEDLANANSHAHDSIAYWVHATVPTLDRFAPIGDQSRNSVPELYDYHRRLMLEARMLSHDPKAQALAGWWLQHISVPSMRSGFNSRYDLLPVPASNTAPTALYYHAIGTGHLFARSGWDRDAMWLAFVAGPYNESHAHQEQGGFTLFAHDWLTVTNNIWSHSGIHQGSELHNVLRFERDAPLVRPCRSTEAAPRVVPQCAPSQSRMTVAAAADGALTVDADLSGAYAGNPAVREWTRKLVFGQRKLRIEDHFDIAPGTRAIFQLQLPVEPTLMQPTGNTHSIVGAQAVGGRLRVRVIEPVDAKLAVIDLHALDTKEFQQGWRLDIIGGSDRYVIELDEARN